MTKIEWVKNADGSAGKTWNPIVGCSIVSPGCTNCYAMRMAARLEAMAVAGNAERTDHRHGGKTFDSPLNHYAGTTQPSKAGAVWTGKVALAPERVLLEPLRRRKPTMWFVNSMGDLFHEDVPDEWIDRVFAVMGRRPDHTFQALTKRAERMRAYMTELRDGGRWMAWRWEDTGGYIWDASSARFDDVFRNVWLGVSAERQAEADERIPELLATPAAVRFVSCEPLLRHTDLTRVRTPSGDQINALNHVHRFVGGNLKLSGVSVAGSVEVAIGQPSLDWVIVGGESGPGARPMHPDWARSIRDQCVAAGVPFFFKQWGEWTPGENVERRTGSVAVAYGDGDEPWAFGSERLDWDGGHVDDEPTLYRIGKRAAGRLLDGREWSEMPESRQNPPVATQRSEVTG